MRMRARPSRSRGLGDVYKRQVVTAGQAFVIKAQETSCSSSLTPYQYAKAVIDSIDLTKRTMIGHVTINLNCGFRSLRDGLPTY